MLKKKLTLDSRTTYKYGHNLAIFVRNNERIERKPFQREYESNYATNKKHTTVIGKQARNELLQ